MYGFSMALIIDCFHNLGTLFSVKHLLSMSYHISMPPAFSFLSDAIPFLYSYLEKVNTSITFIVASVGSTILFARHGTSAVDEQLVCNLIGLDRTWRCWWVFERFLIVFFTPCDCYVSDLSM